MRQSGSLLWRLLRQNISAWQLAGFSVASLVGLAIVTVALQFYCDVKPLLTGEDSFMRRDYIVITRQIQGMGSLLGAGTAFQEDDIAEIESQPWVRRVGRFTTSQYDVTASLATGGHSMSTKLFFESVPEEFIDTGTAGWDFDPSDPEIPVIVARDYLSLYNFGFASAQGMPRVSEGMVAMVPIRFTLKGNGQRETIRGRIVGFSSRLNTIIVPEEFMLWSNARFAGSRAQQPSRLILEVATPGDPAINAFMEERGYEIAGDKADSGKASYFLALTTSIVASVGAVISVLAFFILMLSIHLLLQKNTRRLRCLLLLGYSTAEVTAPYARLVTAINAAVLLLAVAAALTSRAAYLPVLASMGCSGGSAAVPIAVAVAIMALITAGNLWTIRSRVASLWRDNNK